MSTNNNIHLSSVDKMRIIVNWINYQNEHFNERFKSISDIEKAYDYCVTNNLEFLDYLEKEDYTRVVKDMRELLGYSIF